jgi:hypothetical protein
VTPLRDEFANGEIASRDSAMTTGVTVSEGIVLLDFLTLWIPVFCSFESETIAACKYPPEITRVPGFKTIEFPETIVIRPPSPTVRGLAIVDSLESFEEIDLLPCAVYEQADAVMIEIVIYRKKVFISYC